METVGTVQCGNYLQAASEPSGWPCGEIWGVAAPVTKPTAPWSVAAGVAVGHWANCRSRSGASWFPRLSWIHARNLYASGVMPWVQFWVVNGTAAAPWFQPVVPETAAKS